MTVKMYRSSRAVVTETYSDSSEEDQEDFSSQEEEEAELAHAVEDSDSTLETPEGSKKSASKRKLPSTEEKEGEKLGDSTDENLEDDSESGEEEDNQSNVDEDCANSGWADSIAKILKSNKPKKKKTLVLSKAKKLNDPIKAKPKSVGFQIEKEDGAITEEKIITEDDKEKTEVAEGVPRKKRRDIQCLRVKPSVLERDRERLLAKIATKGVVQLFNAVKQQQKDIKNKLEEAGPLEVKRDKALKSVDKRSFLDHLMGDKGKSVKVTTETKTCSQTKKNSDQSTWDVLRDDFMMDSNKMKDWDKELQVGDDDEEETEMEVEPELESD